MKNTKREEEGRVGRDGERENALEKTTTTKTAFGDKKIRRTKR